MVRGPVSTNLVVNLLSGRLTTECILTGQSINFDAYIIFAAQALIFGVLPDFCQLADPKKGPRGPQKGARGRLSGALLGLFSGLPTGRKRAGRRASRLPVGRRSNTLALALALAFLLGKALR